MSMRFFIKHTVFDHKQGQGQECDQNNLPAFLLHKDMKWFLDDHVFTLAVGGKVETDFHLIERIK